MIFEYLWTLYKPGDIVFNGSTTSPHMYKVVGTAYSSDFLGNCRFDLKYFSVDWDGDKFGLDKRWERIESFDGIKKITDLPLYPERFIEERGEVRKRLIARGKKFSALAGSFYRAYRGTAILTGSFDSKLDDRAIYVRITTD